MKDILDRIAGSSPNESSHELFCRLHDCAHEIELLRHARVASEGTHGTATFQARVQPWMLECFGAEISADRMERNHRFFEEASELAQACGMTASEAHQLVDYTWGRPIGEKTQEVGGVMVTLAALCLANGLDMHAAGETELARINRPDMVIRIRAKQASKPKHSPLPVDTFQWPQQLAVEAGARDERELPQSVLDALRFYAHGHHYNIDSDHQQFDTVSGEPQNWLFSERDDDCTMIEDGSIARAALCGGGQGFEEPTTPVEGEIFRAALARASEAEAGEPAIYQFRCKGSVKWMDIANERALNGYKSDGGYETRIVYAAPQPASPLQKLADSQRPLDPEFSRVLNENLADLYATDGDAQSASEQQAARGLSDEHIARLTRLADVLEAGFAYNGISHVNAVLYAKSLRTLLAAKGDGHD
jgi:hypothetical protein